MQAEHTKELIKIVGCERWKMFIVDILHGANTFKLAKKYGISLWNVRLAKMMSPELSLSIIEKQYEENQVTPIYQLRRSS